MSNFTPRKSCPNGNKEYITSGGGGWSKCIVGSPTKSGANVLANCVGYACGRFNELINLIRGTSGMAYPTLNCNAENFIERAIAAGLSVVSDPVPGGIMVFAKGTLASSDGAGHVLIPEIVYSRDEVYTSESGYGGTAFWNQTRKRNSNNWGMGSAYTYRGCIVNPAVKNDPAPAPTPQPSLRPATTQDCADIWAGKYGVQPERDQNLRNAGIDPTGVQARINAGEGKPQPAPQPQPAGEDLLTVVKKTIRGDYGNMPGRKAQVEATGNNYDVVKNQVNANYAHNTTRWDNVRLY